MPQGAEAGALRVIRCLPHRPATMRRGVLTYIYNSYILRLMQFEWDEQKNKLNQAKHGISFEEATVIWDGIGLAWEDMRRDYGESRWLAIGMLSPHGAVVVAYTKRGEKVRIISARPANYKERDRYHAHLEEAS